MRTRLILLFALALYLIAALYQLTLPGLHHDEAQEAALMGMQLQTGLPPTLFRDTGIVINNRAFPLMVQDYIGALNVYLAWIAFGIGGVSVTSLRVMTVIIGALTLLLMYLASRRLTGEKIALLATLMLATHPTFIFWSRQGVYVTSYILTLALAALWLLLRWWQGGRAWNLWLAGFLCGVGLWGKLLFSWFLGGVFIAWLLLNLPRWLSNRDGLRPTTRTPFWTLLIGVICGLIGMSPLMLYNSKSGGTLDNLFNNLDQSYYGVDNSDFGDNLQTRWRQAPEVFESVHLWDLGGRYPNPIGREVLFLAAGSVLIMGILIPAQRGVRLFMLITIALMLVQSCFTSTALWHTHFALILPFLVLLVAVSGQLKSEPQRHREHGELFVPLSLKAYRPLRQRKGYFPFPQSAANWGKGSGDGGLSPTILNLRVMYRYVRGRVLPAWRGLWIGLIAIFISFNLFSTLQYHRALERTGGLANHSDAIYRLVDELETLPPLNPVAALDWGISPATATLTEAQVIPNEVFGYGWEADPGFAARLAPFFALDESVYILHAPAQTVFPRRDIFFQLAAEHGRDLELYQVITTREGAPYFELWRAR